MPSNTSYRPSKVSEFESTKLQANATGVLGSITINGDTNVDLYMADDNLVTGFWLIGSGITFGDYIKLQVIDTDNIYGYGAGTILKTFIPKLYLPETLSEQFQAVYPAKVFTGLSLRVIYTSTATTGDAPKFAVNYQLHKVLA